MKRAGKVRIGSALAVGALLSGTLATGALAASTDNLFFNINASDVGSYDPANPGFWNDLSTENRDGTVFGTLVYDNVNGALQFPNTGQRSDAAGINYVDMGDGFENFGAGITIEFEAHFGGSTIDNWERIFDFGNGQEQDNIWVGNYYATNEVAIELWKPSPTVQAAKGRCRTADDVNAIVANTFRKYVITLDGTRCRMYINGVEVNTVVDGPASTTLPPGTSGSFDVFRDDAANLGSPYPDLPNTVTRVNNYIGRSNWGVDITFNGAIKYVRIYTEALSPTEVADNAATYTLTYSSTGSESGSAPASRSGNGLVTLASNTGNLAKGGSNFLGWATSPNQSTAISGSYNLTADATLYPVFSSNSSSGSSSNSNGTAETALAATGADLATGLLFATCAFLMGAAALWLRRKSAG